MFIGLASLVFATVLALSTYQASSATAACQGVGFGFAHTSAPPVIRCMLVRQNKRLEENELNDLKGARRERIEDAARLEGITFEEALRRRRGFRYLL